MALATLSIDMVAQLAKLQEGMDRAGRIAEKNAAEIEARYRRIGDTAKAVGGAIVSAFAGFSVVQFVRNTADAIDALNDVADATGATVESLSALEAVAVRNGGSLEQVEGILVKFNSALKEARPDNTVGAALKAIGLSADELRRLDPAEALRQTAVALAGYADDGNKARLVQELFGKSIREAAPFLKDLAEQGRLNATVTKEQAEEAERFNKALGDFKQRAREAGQAIVSELLPPMNRFLERLAGLRKAGGLSAALSSIGQEFRANAVSDELRTVVREVESLQKAVEANPTDGYLKKRLLAKRSEADRLLAEAQAASNALKQFATSASPLDVPEEFKDTRSVPLAGLAPVSDQSKGKTKREKSVAEILANEPFNFRRAEIGSTDEVNRALAQVGFDERAKQIKEAADARKRLNDLIKDTPTAKLQEILELERQLAEARDEGRITAEEQAEVLQLLEEQYDALTPPLELFTEKTSEFALEASRNIQDALGDTLVRTLKGDFESIGDLWKDLLLRMVAQATAARLNEALFGASGSGGVFGTILTALFSAKGNAFGPGGQITPFASGGVVNSPTLFGFGGGRLGVMGEAGPEGVLPLKRGRDGKLGVAAQGGGVTIVNNVSSGVSRSEMLSALSLVSQSLRGEVMTTLRRAGVM